MSLFRDLLTKKSYGVDFIRKSMTLIQNIFTNTLLSFIITKDIFIIYAVLTNAVFKIPGNRFLQSL